MSLKIQRLYEDAYEKVRSPKESTIVAGYNRFDELRKLSDTIPLSLREINFNMALAAYRLHMEDVFTSIVENVNDDVRVAQLVELFHHDREQAKIAELRINRRKNLVQQVSFVLITTTVLTFLSQL